MSKMNPNVKEKWVSALRSGEYKKIGGHLAKKDADGEMCFCALGVLCDLDSRNRDESWVEEDKSNGVYYYLGQGGALPKKVMEWAGLGSSDPIIYQAESAGINGKPVSSVNDQGTAGQTNYSFDHIADLIEKNL